MLTLLLLSVVFSACRKGNNKSKIPVLSYLSSTEEVKAGNSEDTIFISFRLEDGDADIITNGRDINLFITNTLDTIDYDYPLPFIGDQFKDPTMGLQATCVVRLLAAFFPMRDTMMVKDSVQFSLKVQDGAGNMSNEITTKYVYLKK